MRVEVYSTFKISMGVCVAGGGGGGGYVHAN